MATDEEIEKYEMRLENEINSQVESILKDRDEIFYAFCDYIINGKMNDGFSQSSSDGFITLIETAANCKFEDRHQPLNAFVRDAVYWDAEQSAKTYLKELEDSVNDR